MGAGIEMRPAADAQLLGRAQHDGGKEHDGGVQRQDRGYPSRECDHGAEQTPRLTSAGSGRHRP